MKNKTQTVAEKNLQFSSVVKAICLAHFITEEEFFSRRRLAPLTDARFLYWHILGRVHNMGLSQIGRLTGYTHGSIFHGKKQVKNKLEAGNDRAFMARFKAISEQLKLKEHYHEVH